MTVHKSDRTLAIDQAITRAHRRADETGLVYAVVEIDHEDIRVIRVVLHSSTWDDEFAAFNGQVLVTTLNREITMGDERNYRAYCYFRVIGLGPAESIRMEGGRSTLQAALDLLTNVKTVSNYTGGGIERKLPGIGWVICEDETECPHQDEDS